MPDWLVQELVQYLNGERRWRKRKTVILEVLAGLATGKIEDGEKLPTVAAQCERLGASENTIGNAYHELKALGLLHRKAGIGMFVLTGAQRKVVSEVQKYEVQAANNRSKRRPKARHDSRHWRNTEFGG